MKPAISSQANGIHAVSQPGTDRARLAVVENEFASVTISLDTTGHSPRLHVQDNETGDSILLSAIELASLCLATSEDRAGWLRVGLYRTDDGAGSHGSGDDVGGSQGADE